MRAGVGSTTGQLGPLPGRHPVRAACLWPLGLLLMQAMPAHAQSATQAAPDAGAILREIEQQRLRIPPTLVPRPAPPAAAPRAPGEVLFTVQHFRLEGVTLLPEARLQEVLAAYRGREIGFGDLEHAMADVAKTYEQEGWLARVLVPEQDIEDATVTLRVTEARLGRIRIDAAGSQRLPAQRIERTMLARQEAGQPLSLRAMERGVSVLSDSPGFTVSAALANGQADTETDIVLTVGERNTFSGSVMLDNGGSRSTGAERGVGSLNFDNILGLGDQFGLSLMKTLGTQYGMLSGSLPVGYEGWRVGASASHLNYQLVGSFASANASGSADTLGLRAQYPLWRSTYTNVNATFNLDHKTFDNQANGATTSRKTSQVFTASVGGDRTDELWGGGYLLWNAALVTGRLDLSANAANAAVDLAGPRTQGAFSRFNATVSRLQRIAKDTTLWLSLSGQRSGKNLDSSEKFALGGPASVRAYPSAEASGDQGWLSTVELRQTLNAQWQASAFIDHGQVRLNHDVSHVPATNTVPNRYGLSAAGLGLSYTPSAKASLRLTVARRLGSNPGANPNTGADADGTRPQTRAWLSASMYF